MLNDRSKDIRGDKIELDDEIAVIRGSIWDNCRDYCRKCRMMIPENTVERVIKTCPNCDGIMGFLARAGIDEYLKILPEDERISREEGRWLHLAGLVYKNFSEQAHVYEDFMPPSRWMFVEGVDPHDARPTNWMFGAVSPEEIEIFGKKKNRIYWFDYLLATGSVDEIARSVKANRALYGYDHPFAVVLDAKFGQKTQMEHKSWQSELERAGIKRIKLSHSAPGDVELGHKIVKEYLKPQFSSLTGAAKPGMMFAREGCRGANGPIKAMQSYQYNAKTGKAEEDFKDLCDCIRYVAMEQFTYRSPEDEANVTKILQDRMKDATDKRQSIQG